MANIALPTVLCCLGALLSVGSIPVTAALPPSVPPADMDDSTLDIYTSGTQEGPWGEPYEGFRISLADTSNATGKFPFSGPNISVSADALSEAVAEIDGWSWSIAVAADLPLVHADADRTDLANQSDLFYTGGSIALNAPSSLVDAFGDLTVADGWDMCLVWWGLNGYNYTDELRSDDGTCTSVLSEECIADMKEAVAKVKRQGYRCTCPVLSSIPSCSELGDKASVFDNLCTSTDYTSKTFRQYFPDGKNEFLSLGDKHPHDKGNRESYDNIGSLSWPILTSFIYKGEESQNGTTTSLTCVRAKDATVGSTLPENSGSWVGVTWTTIGVACALGMLAV